MVEFSSCMKDAKRVSFYSRYFHWLLLSFLFICLSGCGSMRTSVDQYGLIMKNVYAENYKQAVVNIHAAKNNGGYEYKDRVVYFLELGTAFHYAGMYDSSNIAFEKADLAMEDLFTKSISKAAASLLLNDNALDYFGEDYEQIYVNIFKSLNYMHLNNNEAAMVEARRVHIKLNELERKYRELASSMTKSEEMKVEVEYDDSPLFDDVLARYLSMSLYRGDGELDEAVIDLKKINELYKTLPQIYESGQPEFLEKPELTKMPLQILAFTGLAPAKYPVSLSITTYKDLLSIRSVSGQKDKFWMNIPMKIEKGYHFKFELPEMKRTGTQVTKINVYANDKRIGQLETMEDMQNIAYTTFQTHQRLIFFKTLVRSVAKGLAAAELKKEMRSKQKNEGWGFVTDLLTDIAVDATENADLRFWRTMPGFAWAGEFDIEPGVYSIKLEYINKTGNIGATKIFPETNIGKNKLNFIESIVHY